MKKIIWIAAIGLISLSFTKVRDTASSLVEDTIAKVEEILIDESHSEEEESIQETVKDRLFALNQYFNAHPNYEVDVKHIMFTSTSGLSVEESYEGFYRSYNGLEHSLILGVETRQNKDVRVILDTNSKVIMLAEPLISAPVDLSQLDSYLKLAKNERISDSTGNSIIYLEFNPRVCPIIKLSLVIRENRIESMDLWHSEKIIPEGGDPYHPHSRIEYTNYKENKKIKKKALGISRIVEKSNDTYKLTSAYQHYTLLDTRVKK